MTVNLCCVFHAGASTWISTSFRDLFVSLVPLEVQQAVQMFDARRRDAVSAEVQRLRESTALLNGCAPAPATAPSAFTFIIAIRCSSESASSATPSDVMRM